MKKIVCFSLMFIAMVSFTKRVYSQELVEYALLMGALTVESPNEITNSDCQNLRSLEITEIRYFLDSATYTSDLDNLFISYGYLAPPNITIYEGTDNNCLFNFYIIVSVSNPNSPSYFAVLPYFKNYVANAPGIPVPTSISFDTNGQPVTPTGYTITTECPHCASTAYIDTIKSCNKTTFVKDTLNVQGKTITKSLVLDKFKNSTINKLAIIKTDGSIDTTSTSTFNTWNLNGNAGINPANTFLGTTDSKPLIFKANNSEIMRLKDTNNIKTISLGTDGFRIFPSPSASSNKFLAILPPAASTSTLNDTVHSPLVINSDGKVSIGGIYNPSNTSQTMPDGYKLYVAEGILTNNLKIASALGSEWNDYVFNKDYKLMSLKDLETYLDKNKHLPEIPSEKDVKDNGGFSVKDMSTSLLKKVEELTLYAKWCNLV